MYDMLLASLFFLVVLSPLVIHVWLNMAERSALKRELAQAQSPGSVPAKKKDPRSAWAPDTSAQAVSSAAPSAR